MQQVNVSNASQIKRLEKWTSSNEGYGNKNFTSPKVICHSIVPDDIDASISFHDDTNTRVSFLTIA